jgi:hypothetical protein
MYGWISINYWQKMVFDKEIDMKMGVKIIHWYEIVSGKPWVVVYAVGNVGRYEKQLSISQIEEKRQGSIIIYQSIGKVEKFTLRKGEIKTFRFDLDKRVGLFRDELSLENPLYLHKPDVKGCEYFSDRLDFPQTDTLRIQTNNDICFQSKSFIIDTSDIVNLNIYITNFHNPQFTIFSCFLARAHPNLNIIDINYKRAFIQFEFFTAPYLHNPGHPGYSKQLIFRRFINSLKGDFSWLYDIFLNTYREGISAEEIIFFNAWKKTLSCFMVVDEFTMGKNEIEKFHFTIQTEYVKRLTIRGIYWQHNHKHPDKRKSKREYGKALFFLYPSKLVNKNIGNSIFRITEIVDIFLLALILFWFILIFCKRRKRFKEKR